MQDLTRYKFRHTSILYPYVIYMGHLGVLYCTGRNSDEDEAKSTSTVVASYRTQIQCNNSLRFTQCNNSTCILLWILYGTVFARVCTREPDLGWGTGGSDGYSCNIW